MFAFATCERFARLERKDRDRLEALSKLDEFDPGQVILVAGHHSESIYLIADGGVDVRAKTRSGDAILAQLGPGDLFGEVLVPPAVERLAESTGSDWDALNSALRSDEGLRGRLLSLLGSSTALGDHLDGIKGYLRGDNPRIGSAAQMVKTTPPGRGSRSAPGPTTLGS